MRTAAATTICAAIWQADTEFFFEIYIRKMKFAFEALSKLNKKKFQATFLERVTKVRSN